MDTENRQEMQEAFRAMISEKLGMKFSPRNTSARLLVDIEAFPRNVVTDEGVFLRLFDCLKAMGFELELDSIAPDGEYTSIRMKKGEENFSLAVTNAMEPPWQIIITVL